MIHLSMKIRHALQMVLFFVLVFPHSILLANGTRQGVILEQLPTGAYADLIPGATITFLSEDLMFKKVVVADGNYSVSLPAARYRVSVEAPGFIPYTTGKGFCVIKEGSRGTFNFFLERKGVTMDPRIEKGSVFKSYKFNEVRFGEALPPGRYTFEYDSQSRQAHLLNSDGKRLASTLPFDWKKKVTVENSHSFKFGKLMTLKVSAARGSLNLYRFTHDRGLFNGKYYVIVPKP